MKFELVKYCEIDKYASKSYSLIHNVSEELNLGDIAKIDIEKLPPCDLITHGSPCTDFSHHGKNKGGDIGSGTSSSLMWNTVTIVEHCKPKFVIWENVKQVLTQKHKHNFDKYIEKLDVLGYNSYHLVMNAKDYGTPQNRPRIFIVSISKDIDVGYSFPDKKANLFTLQDVIGQGNHILDDRNSGFGIRIYHDYCPCQRAKRHGIKVVDSENNVSTLTPLQAMLLQGFTEEDYNKISPTMPQTQILQQVGNSIVVSVVQSIFEELNKQYPKDMENLKVLSLFSGIGAFERGLERV